MKINKEIKSGLENDKRTLEKRRKVKEKLKQCFGTDENIDEILISLERYCMLILQSIKNE